jgi:hypothetical protein
MKRLTLSGPAFGSNSSRHACSRARNSSAVWKRCAGSTASAFITSCATSGGVKGSTSPTGAMSGCATAVINSPGGSVSKGLRPVMSS